MYVYIYLFLYSYVGKGASLIHTLTNAHIEGKKFASGDPTRQGCLTQIHTSSHTHIHKLTLSLVHSRTLSHSLTHSLTHTDRRKKIASGDQKN